MYRKETFFNMDRLLVGNSLVKELLSKDMHILYVAHIYCIYLEVLKGSLHEYKINPAICALLFFDFYDCP